MSKNWIYATSYLLYILRAVFLQKSKLDLKRFLLGLLLLLFPLFLFSFFLRNIFFFQTSKQNKHGCFLDGNTVTNRFVLNLLASSAEKISKLPEIVLFSYFTVGGRVFRRPWVVALLNIYFQNRLLWFRFPSFFF